MGLTKSPAGVPWNVGVSGLIEQEGHIYSARLVDEWMSQPKRVDVVTSAGVTGDRVKGAMKIAATGIYGFAGDQIQAQSGQSGWTVRQVGALNKQAYEWTRAMPFEEWASFMRETVLPMFTEEGSEA